MIVKLQIEHHLEFLSLKGGYTGWSESTFVIMSHYWKSQIVKITALRRRGYFIQRKKMA